MTAVTFYLDGVEVCVQIRAPLKEVEQSVKYTLYEAERFSTAKVEQERKPTFYLTSDGYRYCPL